MTQLPLHFRDGHLFLEAGGALWLFDTGAPSSFGSEPELTIADKQIRLDSSSMGLTAAKLSRFVAVECGGLLGADVLRQFDFILDAPNGTAAVSSGELVHDGRVVHLDDFMGIPIVTARIRDTDCPMVFDTGAQVSYLQDDSLTSFPSAGPVSDFYPGLGEFETETHHVDVTLGRAEFRLRCGVLPRLLGAALGMAGARGIVGNQVLRDRAVGYFPRRRALVL